MRPTAPGSPDQLLRAPAVPHPVEKIPVYPEEGRDGIRRRIPNDRRDRSDTGGESRMEPTRTEVSRYELLLDWKARPEPADSIGLEKYVCLVRERFEKVEEIQRGRWYAFFGGKRDIVAGPDHVQVIERDLSEDPETFGGKLLSIAEEAFSSYKLTRSRIVLAATILVRFPQPVVSQLLGADTVKPLERMVSKDVRISTSVLWGRGYALQLPPHPSPQSKLFLTAGLRCSLNDAAGLVRRWRRLSSGLSKLVSWAYIAQGVENAST